MATTTVDVQRGVDERNASDIPKVQVTRVIRASRKRVFDAWTRPEFIRQWFASGNTVTDASTEACVGGHYRIEAVGSSDCQNTSEKTDAQKVTSISGTYREVVPYERLVFTWTGSWNPEEETLVTVDLRDVERGTELTLTHERFLTEEMAARHEGGWGRLLVKLQEFSEME